MHTNTHTRHRCTKLHTHTHTYINILHAYFTSAPTIAASSLETLTSAWALEPGIISNKNYLTEVKLFKNEEI